METKLERLAKEALTLNAEERATFAELLIASLEGAVEIDQVWIDEAERRDAELDRGEVEAIPLEKALAQLRTRSK